MLAATSIANLCEVLLLPTGHYLEPNYRRYALLPVRIFPGQLLED
jgi:hypothetical protein